VTVLSALEHQDYPAVLLVERLRPARVPNRPPLCQVMFVLDKPHRIEQQGASEFVGVANGLRMNPGGLVLESMALERRAATLDAVLLIIETQGLLAASMRYNTDLFDSATIAQFSRHFEILLRTVLLEPRTTLDALKLRLVESDQQRQLDLLQEQRKVNLQRLKHPKRKRLVASQPSAEGVSRK
jgi:non-ribosomal peptide synthetase component F